MDLALSTNPVVSAACYCFADCQLDVRSYELARNGRSVHVEPLALDLLVYLINNKERCVTRDELFDKLWPGKVVTDAALSNEIKYLRQKVGDDGVKQSIIRTHHRRGYQFIAATTVVNNVQEPAKAKTILHPHYYTSFVGREREFEIIQHWLEKPGNGLLTLTGPGGIGKTRLANECISRLSITKHQIHYLPLANLHRSSEFIQNLARALTGKAVVVTQHSAEEEALRRIGRGINAHPHLIILDNADQLDQMPTLLLKLLQQAQQLKILVTSRKALNCSSEEVLPLNGLEAKQNTSEGSAMQLFIERMQSLPPETDRERQQIQHICERLDGSPLGIELAAPWLNLMSLNELEEHLKGSLMWLESQHTEHELRHRNISSLFENSWQHLPASRQSAFAGLCLFPSGFTTAAAKSVCNIDLPQLLSLKNLGLIQHIDGQRLHIHELLRQFGLQKLAQLDPEQKILQRLTEYYLSFCHENYHHIESDYNRELIQVVREEWNNLMAIVQRVIEQQDWDSLYQLTLVMTKLPENVLNLIELYEQVYSAICKSKAYAETTDLLYRLLSCYDLSGHYPTDFAARCQRLSHLAYRSDRLFYAATAESLLENYYRFEITNEVQAQIHGENHYQIISQFLADQVNDQDPLIGYAHLRSSAYFMRRNHIGLALNHATRALQSGTLLNDQYLLFSCHIALARTLSLLILPKTALMHFRYCYRQCLHYQTRAEKIQLTASLALYAFAINNCQLAVNLLAKAYRMLNEHYRHNLAVERLLLPYHQHQWLLALGSECYQQQWQAGLEMSESQLDSLLSRLLGDPY